MVLKSNFSINFTCDKVVTAAACVYVNKFKRSYSKKLILLYHVTNNNSEVRNVQRIFGFSSLILIFSQY